jgi:hypothetical protein
MHKLETGNVRHFNIKYNERIYKFLCNKTVEDEIHFLMSCEKLKESTTYFLFKGNLQNISKSQQTAYTCTSYQYIWLVRIEDPESLINTTY